MWVDLGGDFSGEQGPAVDQAEGSYHMGLICSDLRKKWARDRTFEACVAKGFCVSAHNYLTMLWVSQLKSLLNLGLQYSWDTRGNVSQT